MWNITLGLLLALVYIVSAHHLHKAHFVPAIVVEDLPTSLSFPAARPPSPGRPQYTDLGLLNHPPIPGSNVIESPSVVVDRPVRGPQSEKIGLSVSGPKPRLVNNLNGKEIISVHDKGTQPINLIAVERVIPPVTEHNKNNALPPHQSVLESKTAVRSQQNTGFIPKPRTPPLNTGIGVSHALPSYLDGHQSVSVIPPVVVSQQKTATTSVTGSGQTHSLLTRLGGQQIVVGNQPVVMSQQNTGPLPEIAANTAEIGAGASQVLLSNVDNPINARGMPTGVVSQQNTVTLPEAAVPTSETALSAPPPVVMAPQKTARPIPESVAPTPLTAVQAPPVADAAITESSPTKSTSLESPPGSVLASEGGSQTHLGKSSPVTAQDKPPGKHANNEFAGTGTEPSFLSFGARGAIGEPVEPGEPGEPGEPAEVLEASGTIQVLLSAAASAGIIPPHESTVHQSPKLQSAPGAVVIVGSVQTSNESRQTLKKPPFSSLTSVPNTVPSPESTFGPNIAPTVPARSSALTSALTPTIVASSMTQQPPSSLRNRNNPINLATIKTPLNNIQLTDKMSTLVGVDRTTSSSSTHITTSTQTTTTQLQPTTIPAALLEFLFPPTTTAWPFFEIFQLLHQPAQPQQGFVGFGSGNDCDCKRNIDTCPPGKYFAGECKDGITCCDRW